MTKYDKSIDMTCLIFFMSWYYWYNCPFPVTRYQHSSTKTLRYISMLHEINLFGQRKDGILAFAIKASVIPCTLVCTGDYTWSMTIQEPETIYTCVCYICIIMSVISYMWGIANHWSWVTDNNWKCIHVILVIPSNTF